MIWRSLSVISLLLVAATGCSDRNRPELSDDGGIRRRVFSPPPSRVRAVPPHNIHADGIGPYQLGASLGQILNLLPHGPRVELFRLGSVADYSLVRSENGALLVGVERSAGVTFVAAIEPVVARTEGGSEVGTELDKLIADLGPPATTSVRDARLVRTAELPGALFLIDGGQVAAIVVGRAGKKPKAPPRDADAGATPSCRPLPGELESQLLAAARLGTAATIKLLCDKRQVQAAVISWGDRWVWLAISGDKIRRVADGAVEGLALAAPAALGGPPLLLAVSEDRSDDELEVRLEVFRVDKQPVSIERSTLYRLSSSNMRLAGGTVARAMIAVEIELGEQSLTARGLYAQRKRSGELGVVAPLAPREIELNSRPRRPPRPAVDAGPVDATAAGRAIGPR